MYRRYRQPLLYGDEYYIRAETTDGYTVIRDEVTGWICYATLSEDKTSLVSTGIHYGGEQIQRNKILTKRKGIMKIDMIKK